MTATLRQNPTTSSKSKAIQGRMVESVRPLILEQNAFGAITSSSAASWDFLGRAPRQLRGLQLTELIDSKGHPNLLGALSKAMVDGQAEVTTALRRDALIDEVDLLIERRGKEALRTTIRERRVGDACASSAPSSPIGLPADQLADVSHELRTPLNAVIGFADALRQESFGPLGDRRYRDYARVIQESGQHVLSLVNDLLDLSKAEAERLELQPELIEPRSIISSCVGMVRLDAERAGLSIRNLVPADLGSMRIDPKVLRQVVLNLLTNAVKFTGKGGISIRAQKENGTLRITVEDTGIGISPADLKRVGERFYQARQSGVRGAKGSGIGLALTRALATAHGGSLTIESEVNRGTRADVTLAVFEPSSGTFGQSEPIRRLPKRSAA
ncbi:MAG: HAMP domain-containing sensor histidine kinase [Pseudomonadota bacterium]